MCPTAPGYLTEYERQSCCGYSPVRSGHQIFSCLQAVDVEIQAREIIYHKTNLNNIMSAYTGQPFDKVSVPLPPTARHTSCPRCPAPSVVVKSGGKLPIR